MIMNPLVDDRKWQTRNRNKSPHAFRWDESLPSEECVWNLHRYLSKVDPETPEVSELRDIHNKLSNLLDEHIRTSPFSRVFTFISWVVLFLSLPATVAGYIGCFTVVSGSRGNDPLIWLGLEAALSIIRILLWASNPSFDEGTGVTVRLKLATDQPLVTTEKNIEAVKDTAKTLPLIPERRFLERITSYTGPLEQFQSPENVALYFTVTGDETTQQKLVYLTVLDVNTRIAITLHRDVEGKPYSLTYTDAIVTCNKVASEMEATLQSVIDKDHPWRTNNSILLSDLSNYYWSVIRALNRSQDTTNDNSPSHRMFLETLMRCFRLPAANLRTQNKPSALLPRKWNLLPIRAESNQSSVSILNLSLTEHDKLYLRLGYEHYLKTKLVANWSRWIDTGLQSIRCDAKRDCHQALTDPTGASDKVKWELIELDRQLGSEWARREWSLLVSSFDLENILHRRMEECVKQVVAERKNERLGEWMLSEFVVGRRKRLEKEREEAKRRMTKETKCSSERVGRAQWKDLFGNFSPKGMWEAGQQFIDKQWGEAIEDRLRQMEGVSDLDQLVEYNTPGSRDWETDGHKARRIFVEQVGSRFTHWEPQRRNERDEMNATIKRISDADLEHVDDAYQYPASESSEQAVLKFVKLRRLILREKVTSAKVFSATVYDLHECNEEFVCDAIQKSTTRSVINVNPRLVNSIPENDHLLYLSSSGKTHCQEPPFIQRNRDRWWKQTSNSSTFYFSPQCVCNGWVESGSGTIAHIFISLQPRTRLRLRLLHSSNQASVSIQEKSNVLRLISTNEISKKLRLQDFELDELEPGRHELELVVTEGKYSLRDIFTEFFEDLPNKDVGIGENARDLPTGIEETDPSARDS